MQGIATLFVSYKRFDEHVWHAGSLRTLSVTVQQTGCRVWCMQCVTVQPVTLARKVGPGLQDLQTRARRILAERNAKKAEEKTWIGRMVAAKNLNDMKALIKSRDSA